MLQQLDLTLDEQLPTQQSASPALQHPQHLAEHPSPAASLAATPAATPDAAAPMFGDFDSDDCATRRAGLVQQQLVDCTNPSV